MSFIGSNQARSKVAVDSAADGWFHGRIACGVCGQSLDGEPWGTMAPTLGRGWVHYRCMVVADAPRGVPVASPVRFDDASATTLADDDLDASSAIR